MTKYVCEYEISLSLAPQKATHSTNYLVVDSERVNVVNISSDMPKKKKLKKEVI